MLTQKQAEYQAQRAYDAEYKRVMSNPHSAGRASMREDSAQSSANLAYAQKMKLFGY